MFKNRLSFSVCRLEGAFLRSGLLAPAILTAGLLAGSVVHAGPIADYGDAPDTYSTLSSSNGPYHVDTRFEWIGLRGLGSTTDVEADGQPHPFAFGDDLSNGDEEFVLPYTITPGPNSVNVTLSVSDHRSVRYSSAPNQSLYLEGWIDYDHGRTFLNALGADEQFVKMVLDPSTWLSDSITLAVNFSVPSGQFGDRPEWH